MTKVLYYEGRERTLKLFDSQLEDRKLMKDTLGLNRWIRRLCLMAGLVVGMSLEAGSESYIRYGKQKLQVSIAADEVAVLGDSMDEGAPEGGRLGVSSGDSNVLVATSKYLVVTVPDAKASTTSSRQELAAKTGGSKVVPVLKLGGEVRLITTGEIIVHFPEDWNESRIAKVAESYGLGKGRISSIEDYIRIYTVADAFKVLSLANDIAENAEVDYAYPNHINTGNSTSSGFVINDPLFSDQWHLRNPGREFGAVRADANIGSIWNTYTGSPNEVIAVVDDQIEAEHEDLWYNVRRAYFKDYTQSTSGVIDSRLSTGNHGTAVAGVIGAIGGNRVGIIGVAPRAVMINHQVFRNGLFEADSDQEADSQQRLNTAVDIYNNSWGYSIGFHNPYFAPPAVHAAFRKDITTGRNGLGNIIVWAGGNGYQDWDDVNYQTYTNSPYTITVAASNNFGTHAYYSNPGTANLINAPSNGGNLGILTTDFMDDAGNDPGNYDWFFGGTSSAAPLVSGVVALMLQANPTLTWQDVQHILLTTAVQNDPSHPGWEDGLTYEYITEDGLFGHTYWYNNLYGFGRVDAEAAVHRAESFISTGPRTSRVLELADSNLVLVGPEETIANEFEFDNMDNLFVEHVEVVIEMSVFPGAEHHSWHQYEFVLTSPNGTTSLLSEAAPGSVGQHGAGLSFWPFRSVRHYGEPSRGLWKLTVRNASASGRGEITHMKLSIQGRPDTDNGGAGDGLPDDWERFFFGNNANLDVINPNGDENLDNVPNYFHFLSGTDPYSRDAIVYSVQQSTSGRGDSSVLNSYRNGMMVDDRGNRNMKAIMYYSNLNGEPVFHEEHWGTMTEAGGIAVQKFVAKAAASNVQVLASADYVDTPPKDLLADTWRFRTLFGTTNSTGLKFGMNRGFVATKLNGFIFDSNMPNERVEFGSLGATIDERRTIEVNKPNVTPEEILEGVRSILLEKGYIEQKLTLTLTNSMVSEAGGTNVSIGTITRSTRPLVPLTVILTNGDSTEINIPSRVTIPPAASSTTFAIDAIDDIIADGDKPVVIRANTTDHTPGVATIIVTDNE